MKSRRKGHALKTKLKPSTSHGYGYDQGHDCDFAHIIPQVFAEKDRCYKQTENFYILCFDK